MPQHRASDTITHVTLNTINGVICWPKDKVPCPNSWLLWGVDRTCQFWHHPIDIFSCNNMTSGGPTSSF